MQDQHNPTGVQQRFNEGELVFMMGEELKKPLTVIKSLAESGFNQKLVQLESKKALRTIDNVLLYQSLSAKQTKLRLEPVHIGSTLVQVAEDLRPLSIERGCETEVFIQSGISTVDVDSKALRSGIESLWQAVLGMTENPSPIVWNIYRSQYGIRISVTNNSIDLSGVTMTKDKGLAGRSKQPLSGIAGPATDLLTASGLFSLLGSRITKMHKGGINGLAATLPISDQLVLV